MPHIAARMGHHCQRCHPHPILPIQQKGAPAVTATPFATMKTLILAYLWSLAILSLLLAPGLLTPFAATALAAATKEAEPARRQVVFLPFAIDVPGSHAYLQNGLASMLASRLASRANIAAVSQGGASEQMATALKTGNHEAFSQQLQKSGAEFLVIGSLARKGDFLELATYVFSRNAGQPPRKFSRSLPAVDGAMTAVDEIAWEISGAVFGKPRPEEAATAPAQGKGTSAFQTAHPERAFRENLMAGSTAGLEAGGRFELVASNRSRNIPVDLMDMNAGDLDGDGTDEIVLLTKSELLVYRLQDGQFQKIETFPLPKHLRYHAVTLADLNGNGRQELYVCASANNSPDIRAIANDTPVSSVFEFDGQKLTQLFGDVGYYLQAIAVPGETPLLLGQKTLSGDLGDNIYQMELNPQGGVAVDKQLNIPKGFNLFDFSLGDINGDGSREFVAINNANRMQVYDASGALLWTSVEVFGASDSFFGASPDRGEMDKKATVYLKTRIAIQDLDGDGANDVLVGKNRLETVPLMPNLRYYEGSSIAALKWAQGALAPLWETRKIPNYTVNYQALLPKADKKQVQLVFAEAEKSYPFVFWQSSSLYLNSQTLRVAAASKP